jgi:hypothetical protein
LIQRQPAAIGSSIGAMAMAGVCVLCQSMGVPE